MQKVKPKGSSYNDLPKLNDHNIIVLEKTIPGFKEETREEAFVQKLQIYDDQKRQLAAAKKRKITEKILSVIPKNLRAPKY